MSQKFVLILILLGFSNTGYPILDSWGSLNQFWIRGESIANEKKLPPSAGDSTGKIHFDPRKEEGYFQGWNFYFQSGNRLGFVTFLVSNLGPGDLNNGVSVYLNSPETGVVYKTQEYADFDLTATPGRFGQISGQNKMFYEKGKYHIHIENDEMVMDMVFSPRVGKIFPLSHGEHKLNSVSGFLRADIGFTESPVSIKLVHKGKKIYEWKGRGGMEHLNTNTEVYKFSKSWEILRAYTPEGEAFFFGGFSSSLPGREPSYKRVLFLDKKGRILRDDEVDRVETKEKKLNSFSGYSIPVHQKLYLKKNKSCFLNLRNRNILGVIDILSNISSVLKMFIQLFFSKPYQIHYSVSVELDCDGKKTIFPRGIHSFYLINH